MKQKIERTAVPKDGKDGFFRRLNLDGHTKKLISNYRILKQKLDRDPDAGKIN